MAGAVGVHYSAAADSQVVHLRSPGSAVQPPYAMLRTPGRRSIHHADDATNFARSSLADRTCIMLSAAALMAAVTTR
jgi:hypothetical protein